MEPNWAQLAPAVTASFVASSVECVEALTVVLAVGSTRSWKSALMGAAAGIGVIFVLIGTLGKAVSGIPLHALQWVVGGLLLLFGLRWLRKAILRASGNIPVHDEEAAFAKNTAAMRVAQRNQGSDKIAFATAFQIVLLEGSEVVFIVIAIGAGGPGLLLPASLGALAALLIVVALGFALRHPLASVPENTLKFIVGVLLSAFGTFWFGEGIQLDWPGDDWSILVLLFGYLAISLLAIPICRNQPSLSGSRGLGKGRVR